MVLVESLVWLRVLIFILSISPLAERYWLSERDDDDDDNDDVNDDDDDSNDENDDSNDENDDCESELLSLLIAKSPPNA